MRTGMVMVLALGLVAAGCSGSSEDAGESSSTTTVPEYEVALEDVPCDSAMFTPPRLPADVGDVTCATLTVPEDRADPGGTSVVLPVAVVAGTDPAAEPLVFLQGGPGFSGFGEDRIRTLVEVANGGDVVVFDQRGVGLAEPSLDCPEVNEALLATLETADDPVEEHARYEDAFVVCADRLREQGTDLDQYDTAATVADLIDLREALGIDTWNVLGASYGSTVALEALRADADHLRSVILDSPQPGFVDDTAPDGYVAEAARAFGVLIDSCAEDPTCTEANGDLAAGIAEMQAALNQSPATVDWTDPDGGVRTFAITGDDSVWAIYKGLYLTSVLPVLPTFITQLAAGDPAPVDVFLAQGLPVLIATADGARAVVTCADRGATTAPVDLARLRSDEPVYSAVLLDEPQYPEICERLGIESTPLGDVGSTDVPTLLLAGDHDPRLDPADAAETASRLGDEATFIELTGVGHETVGAAPCPTSLAAAFIADPTAELDLGCVDEGTSAPGAG
jgi:pimeloyl-ACP methyl ester carboxylesterase